MLDGYAKKNFANNNRELNIETIINNFENEIGTSQFRTQNYKQFIDKTEEVCAFLKHLNSFNNYFKNFF